ncbi:MAG: transcriptional regulator, partial [Bacteroidetes bacterium]
DYTSNGSVQVMLFRNRLEIWNPGQLPHQLSIADLKKPHGSFPPNPLIAEPLYLAGYIERLGTGIPDMISRCIDAGLSEPEFYQEESFKAVIRRKSEIAVQATEQVTEQVTEQATEQVSKLIRIMEDLPFSLSDLMQKLELKHRPTFLYNYLKPALENKWIEMTNPESPNSPNQRYRITTKGKELKKDIQNQ